MAPAALEGLGYVASITLAFCALPQVIYSMRVKNAYGVDSLFLALWAGGEVLMVAYVFLRHGMSDIPLLANYLMNLLFLGVIIYYKLFPKE